MDTIGRKGENFRKKRTKGTKLDKARKKPKVNTTYLPDDVIISNILCRLPAKIASQSRLVCKGWKDLTLTRDFVDLHLRCSFPTIMVAYTWRCSSKIDHLLLDKWWETAARKRLMTHTFPFNHVNFHSHYYVTLFSHGGLIAFRGYGSISGLVTILNPISHEKVTVSIGKEILASTIYGVFFHPSLNEYCSLWRIEGSSARQVPIKYKLLILGSSPYMKTMSNRFIHRVKKLHTRPLLIDKYLYWMLEAEDINGRSDIMQFDIIRDEFNIKPCPVPVDTYIKCDSTQMHILNIDGALAFVVIFPCEIIVWRLNNDPKAKELWTATNYTFFSFSKENFNSTTEPVAVVDGHLALLSNRRLVVCNLMQGTTCFHKTIYPYTVYFLSHQMSLASLRNCQATIYIDDKGEV